MCDFINCDQQAVDIVHIRLCTVHTTVDKHKCRFCEKHSYIMNEIYCIYRAFDLPWDLDRILNSIESLLVFRSTDNVDYTGLLEYSEFIKLNIKYRTLYQKKLAKRVSNTGHIKYIEKLIIMQEKIRYLMDRYKSLTGCVD